MAGYIEDRWLKKRPDKLTGKRERTAIYGTGKRYRVKGIPGIQDRSFHTSEDAKQWLASAKTDSSRGEFVDPARGRSSSPITSPSTGGRAAPTSPRRRTRCAAASGITSFR